PPNDPPHVAAHRRRDGPARRARRHHPRGHRRGAVDGLSPSRRRHRQPAQSHSPVVGNSTAIGTSSADAKAPPGDHGRGGVTAVDRGQTMQVRRFLFPAVAGAFALCVGASQASIPASPVATSYDAREAAPAPTPVPAPPQLAPPATVDTATRAVPAPAAPASAEEVPAAALAAYHRAESVINSA